jgi:hypothetical protein
MTAGVALLIIAMSFAWLTIMFLVSMWLPHDVGRWIAQVHNAYDLWREKKR